MYGLNLVVQYHLRDIYSKYFYYRKFNEHSLFFKLKKYISPQNLETYEKGMQEQVTKSFNTPYKVHNIEKIDAVLGSGIHGVVFQARVDMYVGKELYKFTPVAIKFTYRYEPCSIPDQMKWLSSINYKEKGVYLYEIYQGEEYTRGEIYGGCQIMRIYERLDYKILSDKSESFKMWSCQNLARTIQLLQESDHVHGDIRMDNIALYKTKNGDGEDITSMVLIDYGFLHKTRKYYMGGSRNNIQYIFSNAAREEEKFKQKYRLTPLSYANVSQLRPVDYIARPEKGWTINFGQLECTYDEEQTDLNVDSYAFIAFLYIWLYGMEEESKKDLVSLYGFDERHAWFVLFQLSVTGLQTLMRKPNKIKYHNQKGLWYLVYEWDQCPNFYLVSKQLLGMFRYRFLETQETTDDPIKIQTNLVNFLKQNCTPSNVVSKEEYNNPLHAQGKLPTTEKYSEDQEWEYTGGEEEPVKEHLNPVKDGKINYSVVRIYDEI